MLYQQPSVGPIKLAREFKAYSPAFVYLPVNGGLFDVERWNTLSKTLPVGAAIAGTAWKNVLSGTSANSLSNTKLVTSNGIGTGDFTILVSAVIVPNASNINMLYASGGGSTNIYLCLNALTDFTQNSGSVSFSNGSTGVSASVLDGLNHIVGVRRIGTSLTLWIDGIQVAINASFSSAIYSSGAVDNLCGWSTGGFGTVDPVHAVIGFNAGLADTDMVGAGTNLWQLFEDNDTEDDVIWLTGAVGGGALAGTAAAVASATGALSVAVPLAGAAVGVTTATGSISTVIPLAGAAAAVASAGGNLVLGIALSGGAIAQAVAAGTLGTAFPLGGNAHAIASSTGTMTIQVSIAGNAIAQASASGTLTVGGSSSLAGNAQASATATGTLSTAIPLAGAALVVAAASGNLGTGIPLVGAAVAVITANGNLSVSISLTGPAVAQAIAAGGMSVQVPLSGAAVTQASAAGQLSGGALLVSNPRFSVIVPAKAFAVTAPAKDFSAIVSAKSFSVTA